MCGCAIIGDKFVVETLDYFLQKDVLIGEVNNPVNIKKSIAKQFIYNRIEVGYPEYNANDLNGKFEVNSRQQWELNIKSLPELRDLTTSYKASVYEIEYLRSSLFGARTKDNNNDNSIYLLYCSPTVNSSNQYVLQKYPTAIITGVPSPATLYNISFSPCRTVRRHLPFHKSILNVLNTEYNSNNPIEFVSADRNAELETYLLGVTINEKADILPANVPLVAAQSKLFIPLILEFEAKPETALLQAVKNNPYGYLRVNNNGTYFNCFILDIELVGAENDAYKFITLLTPEQDTTQFIS